MSITSPQTLVDSTKQILAANEAEIVKLTSIIERATARIQELRDDSHYLLEQRNAYSEQLIQTAELDQTETFNPNKLLSFVQNLPGISEAQLENHNPLQNKAVIQVKLNTPKSKQKIEAQFMYCRKDNKLMLYLNSKFYPANEKLIDSINSHFGSVQNVNSPKRSVYFWTNLNPKIFA